MEDSSDDSSESEDENAWSKEMRYRTMILNKNLYLLHGSYKFSCRSGSRKPQEKVKNAAKNTEMFEVSSGRVMESDYNTQAYKAQQKIAK